MVGFTTLGYLPNQEFDARYMGMFTYIRYREYTLYIHKIQGGWVGVGVGFGWVI